MTKLDTLKQQTADLEAKLEETTEKLKSMKAEIDRLENGWGMKCPYENDDDIYAISSDGEVLKDYWVYSDYERNLFAQGNTFPTEEAALLEAKRRNLLTRFRAFRDECNGDWKADFENPTEEKFSICFYYKEFRTLTAYNANDFATLGYFKNKKDCERAIKLFGGEIKELFVEG